MKTSLFLMLPALLAAAPAPMPSPEPALVTAEEASRPDAAPRRLRGLFPGPAVKMVLPTQAAEQPVRSPFRLHFEFVPRNGASVDLSSMQITYLKSPPADLTSRFLAQASVSSAGIDLPRTNLPPGRHSFLVSIADSNGNRGIGTYTLVVAR